MRYVFWQDQESVHQVPFLRELSNYCQVTLVLQQGLASSRRDLGWEELPYGRVTKCMYSDDSSFVDALVLSDKHDCLHLFSNPFGDQVYRKIWPRLLRRGYKVGFVHATPGCYSAIFGRVFRAVLYRVLIKLYGGSVSAFIVHGVRCRKYLIDAGVPAERTLTWGYFPFVDKVFSAPLPNDVVRFVFVGRFVEDKRIQWVLHAIAECRRRGIAVQFHFYGDGPLRHMIDMFSGADVFVGRPVKYSDVSTIFASSDCLLLPSVREEWGAVVNESLLNGCPCIVSSECGSSDLLLTGAGLIASNLNEFTRFVTDFAANSILRKRLREAAEKQSENITPRVASLYFHDSISRILRGEGAGVPPWLE